MVIHVRSAARGTTLTRRSPPGWAGAGLNWQPPESVTRLCCRVRPRISEAESPLTAPTALSGSFTEPSDSTRSLSGSRARLRRRRPSLTPSEPSVRRAPIALPALSMRSVRVFGDRSLYAEICAVFAAAETRAAWTVPCMSGGFDCHCCTSTTKCSSRITQGCSDEHYGSDGHAVFPALNGKS